MLIGLVGTPRSIDPNVRPELLADLPQGTVLRGWPSRIGLFPSSPVERDMQAIGHLEAGLRAVEGGARALVLDTLGDYGLEALRSAVSVPVTGAGEAGMAAAARHGRFAIVTVWPASMNFIPRSLLRLYGHEAACIAIHNVGGQEDLADLSGPQGYLARIAEGESEVFARIGAAIDAAVDAGAQAILLGCTCMSGLAERLGAKARVPVVNPLLEAAREAVAATSGQPDAGAVLTARRNVASRMVDALADLPEEACPVCVAE